MRETERQIYIYIYIQKERERERERNVRDFNLFEIKGRRCCFNKFGNIGPQETLGDHNDKCRVEDPIPDLRVKDNAWGREGERGRERERERERGRERGREREVHGRKCV